MKINEYEYKNLALTGSVSIVLECDAMARNANKLKMMPLMILYEE